MKNKLMVPPKKRKPAPPKVRKPIRRKEPTVEDYIKGGTP